MHKRLFVLVTIFILILFIAIIQHVTEYVYVSPRVNTSVFLYLADVIKPLDSALNNSLKLTNKQYGDMKYTFKTGYGSGFLIGNPIPNDLDYSVGVNLGKYEYDGTNASEIANDLFNKISLFQAEFCNYVASDKDSALYCEFSAMDSIINFGSKRKRFVKDIISSIDNVLLGEEYVKYSKKTFSSEITIDFPFILKADEILIEDFPPITLFSDKIKYSEQENEDAFLRELSVVFDYSFMLKNADTGKVKRINLIAESFNGQKMELSQMFFVPIVFVGEDSAYYLKNISYLNDDEEYLKYRLNNYGSHIQQILNWNSQGNKPVKILKRILQCLDLIYPALAEKDRDNIFNSVTALLNSRDVYLINNYSTAVHNLFKMSYMPNIFYKAKNEQQLLQLLSIMDNSIKEMNERKILSDDEYKKLHLINKNLILIIYNSKSAEELQENIRNNKETISQMKKDINAIEEKAYEKIFKNQNNLTSYLNVFYNVYSDAGFHRIDLYWLDNKTMGVLKDEFTSKIPPKELHKMAIENDLVDVNYKLIDADKIDLKRVRYSVWVRYNSSQKENENYQKLRKVLLDDKKNFNIKRSFVF